MLLAHRDIRSGRGRLLSIGEGGEPSGRPIFVLNGTPGSGATLYPAHLTDAKEKGIRLIGYDRPGYGRSTPAPGRAVADAAKDVRRIADTLGLEHFAVWGISGGGPHALACAARLRERVVGVASLASPAPLELMGGGWWEGMGADNVTEFGVAIRGRAELAAFLRSAGEAMMRAKPAELAENIKSLLSEADSQALTGEFAEHLSKGLRAGLANGFDGWVDDDLAMVSSWRFSLSEIQVPVLLLHGGQDRFVPPSHGRWLAAHLPGVDARLPEADGHLTLFKHRVGEVHDWLLAQF